MARSILPAVPEGADPAPSVPDVDEIVFAERIALLYARSFTAQITVVVNATIVAAVFWRLRPHSASVAWLATLCAIALARMFTVCAYRGKTRRPGEARRWARVFVVGAALTGLGWGAAALILYVPASPAHDMFLAFVLGGMAAGAASSDASHAPAFAAFTAPALLPITVRFAGAGDPIHAAMAFMLALFGVAVAAISRTGSRAIEDAIRLRLRNEALVARLTVDVAERKQIGEALREADRRKDEFLGVLSHELRNPLAPMRNALYILDKTPAGSEQAGRAIAVIGRQVDHLTRLVDELLDVTRIARGKITLQRNRLDLRDLVLRTVEDHRQVLSERGIALDVCVTPGPLFVEGDATRISQVVRNLLQNSAKFTDPGGRVIVAIERDGDRVSISVRDTGIGVSPDMVERMFEPFTQAESSLHRSRGGLGLGLALVRGIVELHGGDVEARSDGIGCGTEITVRLPLAAAVIEPQPHRRPLPAPARPRRILIIEDDVDTAETLREMLEIWGHEVDVAHAGRQGLERARAFRPEIILCDIGLPEMDGYEVARTTRSDPMLSSAVLVAMTGYAWPEDQRRAAEAGFQFHVAKPVSDNAIEEVLARADALGQGEHAPAPA